MRRRLWVSMNRLWSPGMTVLDVGAGTGVDAAYLQQQGITVVALDAVQAMLEILKQRCPGVETITGDFRDLGSLLGGRRFNGIVSSFAALNTADDLGLFAAQLARHLAPGGAALLHMLNRWPLLDLARHLGRRRVGTAAATSIRGHRTVMIGTRQVRHYFYGPYSMYRRWFADEFVLERVTGMGIVTQVSGKNRAGLVMLENKIAHKYPFNSLGTFFAAELRKRDGGK